VLPLMRAASRSSTRRKSSTPPKRREVPSIPAAGQNVACKSATVRICVEGLLIFDRARSVASGSSATGKLSFASTWHYSRLSVHLLCTNSAVVQGPVHLLTRQALHSNGPPAGGPQNEFTRKIFSRYCSQVVEIVILTEPRNT
jgi:hypothetical protein